MSNEELQTVVEAVIHSLKTNGKTIDQLTAVQTLLNGDCFEIGGGRKISYEVLVGLLSEAIGIDTSGIYTDIAKTVLQSVTISADGTTATLSIKQAGYVAKTVSIPVATSEQSGIITVADRAKYESAYSTANSALSKANEQETKIEDLEDAVFDITDYDKNDLTANKQYLLTGVGDTAPTTATNTSSGTYCGRWAIKKGAIVTIATQGWSDSARAYALTDSVLEILTLAAAGTDTTSNPVTLVAEEDGWVYVNCKTTALANFSVVIKENEMLVMKEHLDEIDESLAELYEDVSEDNEWESNTTYSLAVGSAPSTNTTLNYCAVKIDDLIAGDTVLVRARCGSSWNYGAKVKNGVVVELLNNETSSPYEKTIVVDDTFDCVIVNNYTGYISEANVKATVTRKVPKPDVLAGEIEELGEEIVERGKRLNLLCLGNSFTQDTVSYIPWLIKEAEPDMELNVYFTFIGGSTLAEYLAYITGGTVETSSVKYENHGGWDRIYLKEEGQWVTPASDSSNYHKSYTLYKYDNNASAWTSVSEPVAADVLALKKWDVITVQQSGSTNYASWDTYFKPYIYKIQAELQRRLDHNFKFGYIMTHASYSTDAEELLTRYAGIVTNTGKMLEETPVEVLFPYATAIQNARSTYLDRFGANGHLMADNAHVNDGVGCLVCAYANAMAVLALIGSEKSVVGSQIYPDSAWLTAHNIPAVSSTVEGLSPYNVWLAQQCAVMAVKHPLQLTDMVAKHMCGKYEVTLDNANVVSSNPILSADEGEAWETALTATTGHTISDVAVTMGGTDITATAYDSATDTVSVGSVTGRVIIVVTTT